MISASNMEAPQQPAHSAPVLARQLLADHVGENNDPAALAAAGHQAYLQLREHLAVLLGSAGFDALWARSMHLAQPKFLPGHTAAAQASFPTGAACACGLQVIVAGRDSEAVQHNLVVAFASFMTLLFTFIGEELGLRFMYQIWPDLAPDALASPVETAR